MRALLLALAAGLAGLVHAQTARPEQAERVTIPSILCKGSCDRMDLPGYLFAQPGQKEAVLISHGSQGINKRMYDYVDGLHGACGDHAVHEGTGFSGCDDDGRQVLRLLLTGRIARGRVGGEGGKRNDRHESGGGKRENFPVSRSHRPNFPKKHDFMILVRALFFFFCRTLFLPVWENTGGLPSLSLAPTVRSM